MPPRSLNLPIGAGKVIVGLSGDQIAAWRGHVSDDIEQTLRAPITSSGRPPIIGEAAMPSPSSFFARYADAYLAFDPQALSAFYALPSMIVDGRGDHLIVQETDLLAYMRPFLGRLEEKGLQRIDPEISAELPLSEDSCFCSIRYRLAGRHRETLGDFMAHYVLTVQDEDWRITFAKVGQVYSWTV